MTPPGMTPRSSLSCASAAHVQVFILTVAESDDTGTQGTLEVEPRPLFWSVAL